MQKYLPFALVALILGGAEYLHSTLAQASKNTPGCRELNDPWPERIVSNSQRVVVTEDTQGQRLKTELCQR